MKLFVVALALLMAQVPKNDPDGTWQAEGSSSQYEIQGRGSELQVKIVPGSNPKFIQYDVVLKNEGEVNTYKGSGTFVAKMEGGKECKFPTEWRFVVVAPDRIFGAATNIIADSKTCEVKQKSEISLDLRKKK